MTDRIRLDDMTDDALDQLYAELDRLTAELADYDQRVQQLTRELAALRQVARGYCPQCGRGDAAPTVEDWEQQKQRADRAEAAIARVREVADRWQRYGNSGLRRYTSILLAALNQSSSTAAPQTTGHQEQQ